MKKVLEVTNTKSVNAEKEIIGLKEINENLIKDLTVLNGSFIALFLTSQRLKKFN